MLFDDKLCGVVTISFEMFGDLIGNCLLSAFEGFDLSSRWS